MSLRALPRFFVEGATPDAEFDLPKGEIDKIRRVLRLSSGAKIAVLPGDGSLIECEFLGHGARPLGVHWPSTEPTCQVTIAQALPKGDKIDEIVRACTEIGVVRFILFPSERTVVRWDARKTAERLTRLQTIAREAAEVSFRTKLPTLAFSRNLAEVLALAPDAVVLSESEGLSRQFGSSGEQITVVVGPEGGWSGPELALIGDRGATLGPRVLRVDHAAPAAAALLLLSS